MHKLNTAKSKTPRMPLSSATPIKIGISLSFVTQTTMTVNMLLSYSATILKNNWLDEVK